MNKRGQASIFDSDLTVYCADTSAFVELKRGSPLDLYPTPWNRLDELMTAGRLISPNEVLKELSKRDDQLYRWAKSRERFFLSPDEELQNCLTDVMAVFPDCVKEYTTGGPFADPYVVALAMCKGASVLTFEKKDQSNSLPRIPKMCEHFKVEWMNTHDMFRKEKMTF